MPAISSAKTGLVLSVNGSTRFIENDSGRGETCGNTAEPFSMPSRCMASALRWLPVELVSSAVHVMGMPSSRCRS